MTILLSLLLTASASVHGPLIATDFDLSDVSLEETASDDPRRYLIGEVEAADIDRSQPKVRLRGAKVKLRVPIG